MTRCYIINPKACRGHGLKLWQRQKQKLPIAATDQELVIDDWDQLKPEARRCLEDGASLLVAVGGDGTVNQVASAFFQEGRNLFPEVGFATVPTGTGCDFYRSTVGSMDVPSLFNGYREKYIDVIHLQTEDNDYYSINTVSLGISTRVMQLKETLPNWVPASLSYVLPALRAALSWESQRIKLTIDGTEFDSRYLAIFMGKGLYGGGGLKLGEADSQGSGYLEVTLVPALNIFSIVKNLGSFVRRGLRQLSVVDAMQAESVDITRDSSAMVEVDGELVPFHRLRLNIIPQSLKTLVPAARETV